MRQSFTLLLLWVFSQTLSIRPTLHRFKKLYTLRHLQNDDTNFNPSLLLPDDTNNVLYVGDWKYYYRNKGMQTSSDDVLVAFIASLPCYDTSSSSTMEMILKNPETFIPLLKRNYRPMSKYIDLGCGIGSTLLLITHQLKPTSFALGFEVQNESVKLIQTSIRDIKISSPSSYINNLFAYQCDIRNILNNPDFILDNSLSLKMKDIYHTCDLLTANPPYLPVTNITKSIPYDLQRRSARFEFHGGVEEYCLVASQLLVQNGSFVMSYWSKDSERVHDAAKNAGLIVKTQINVLMGRNNSDILTTNKNYTDTTTNNTNNSKNNCDSKTSNSNTNSIPCNQESTDTNPYLSIFEMVVNTSNKTLHSNESSTEASCQCQTIILDLRFNNGREAVGSRYKLIRQFLDMHSRPLKRSSSSGNTSSTLITGRPAKRVVCWSQINIRSDSE